jgi:hypothetical protein
MATIQVWSAPSCQSGAVCYGALAPWVSAAATESIGTAAGFRVTVPRDVADRTSLAEGRCLRVLSSSRGEQWWFVSSVADADDDTGLVTVTAGSLLQLLAVRGLVRDGGTFQFTPGRRTVGQLLDAYVFTNLGTDQLSWLSLGTISFTDTIEVGTLDRLTRGGILSLIEQQTGHTARLRPFYIAGALAAFLIDIVSDLGDGLDTITLAAGTHLSQVQRTRDALRAGTVAVPFSTSGVAMDLTQWVVQTFTAGTPAWIPLRDPVSGAPWPIRENGQLIGSYLERADGGRLVVLDSRASDSAVQIASSGGITAGDRVTLTRDSAGLPQIELASPAGLAGSRGRLVATVNTSISDARRNYAVNGHMARVTSNEFDSWSGTKAYARTTPQTWTAFVGSALTSGVTYSSLPYTGATVGSVVQAGEWIRISAGGSTQWVVANPVNDLHIVGATGAGNINIQSWTAPANYTTANALDVTLENASVTLGSGRRPSAFPTENAGTSVASVRDTAISVSAWATYDAARPYVRAAVGISAKTDTTGATSSSSERPSIKIFAPTGSATLASATTPTDFTNSEERHYTLSCGASLASSRLIRVEFKAGDTIKMASYLRWASLWLDTSLTSADMGPQSDSASNVLWHRAQDVLALEGTGIRYAVKGVDLRRLQQDNVALSLGQWVRLRSAAIGVDATVRIVKMDYAIRDDEEAINLELGTITPRLTGVTVSL